LYPLFLDLTHRLAVVVGGGTVGRRKAHGLLQAGGSVRLVCLEPRPVEDVSPALDWISEPYHATHLADASLVIAAATPEVNRQVVADAHEKGILVCSASDPVSGDFLSASVIRRGDLIVAVGSGGSAPALTRMVSRHLDEMLDEHLGEWLAILAELRPRILKADPPTQKWLWSMLCDDSWPGKIRAGGVESVRAIMTELVASRTPPL
jgi:precorrin-2 dehydrogenase/sirohydrochlorin ferrochelatase